MFVEPCSRYNYQIYTVLLVIVLTITPITTKGTDYNSTIANAMFKMMEAMGFVPGSTPNYNNNPTWNFSNQFPNTTPLTNNGNPWQAIPWQPQPPVAPVQLDGIWINNSGEHLAIKRPHFRLASKDGRTSDGLLQIQGHLIAFYQPNLNWIGVYEYVLHDNRLVLRSSQGQTLLYVRIQ